MLFAGFEPSDFEVFNIQGLDPRMSAIKAQIRPKLEALGLHFTSFLMPLVGDDVYAHVAKHARRTVNAPDDTWVAFSTNARGYKQHPHYQIGLWKSHVFATFGYIYEATGKVVFGRALAEHRADVKALIPQDYCWIPDHTKPEAIPAQEVGIDEIDGYAKRLQSVKKAELLVGKQWSAQEVCSMSGEKFIEHVEGVFTQLAKLNRMAGTETGNPLHSHEV